MAKIVLDMSMSLDGFITGPEDNASHGLGLPAGRDWLVRRSRCCAGLSSGMDSQADRMPSVRIVTKRTSQGFL